MLRRDPRRDAFILGLLLVLAACSRAASGSGNPSGSPALSAHAEHDAALAALEAQLVALGLSFETAGPHHRLGVGADGVEVDLVGVPLEEAVLSVPAGPAAAAQRAAPYLAPLEAVFGTGGEVQAWLAELAAGSELDAEVALAGADVTVRSTADPAYVVLTIARR